MNKVFTYLVTYFPTYLPKNDSTYIYKSEFLLNCLPMVKPNINSVKVHPQLSNKKHPVDGAMVGAG
jgi:hypothetical protein